MNKVVSFLFFRRENRFWEAKNAVPAHKASEYRPGTQFRSQLYTPPSPPSGAVQRGLFTEPWQSLKGTSESGKPHPQDESWISKLSVLQATQKHKRRGNFPSSCLNLIFCMYGKVGWQEVRSSLSPTPGNMFAPLSDLYSSQRWWSW